MSSTVAENADDEVEDSLLNPFDQRRSSNDDDDDDAVSDSAPRFGRIPDTPVAVVGMKTQWKLLLIAVVVCVVVVMIVTLALVLPRAGAERIDYHRMALELLASNPLIDTHNDLPFEIRLNGGNPFAIDLINTTSIGFDTDIKRLRAGGLAAQFWSIYIGCEQEEDDGVCGSTVSCGSGQAARGVQMALEQIDIVYAMVAAYPDDFEIARTAADIEAAFGRKRIASLMGLEGGHMLGLNANSMPMLRTMYQLGVRYMTLTHQCNTPWASSCYPPLLEPALTPYGEQIVAEMNRLGMLVDLSHVSPDVMRRVLAITKAPVIFSHSSAYGLCPVPRNVPDDVLEMLPQNGGVVQVNYAAFFISNEAIAMRKVLSPADFMLWLHTANVVNVSTVADHIEYIRGKAGVDHVGMAGSDFDGVGHNTPQGLTDVSMYPNLIAELLRRKWSGEDVVKVMGANLLRALRRAEAVAASMKQHAVPFSYARDPSPGLGPLLYQVDDNATEVLVYDLEFTASA